MLIKCNVCDEGMLEKKSKFRLNGVLALIGLLLLAPSIPGIFLGFSGLFSAGGRVLEATEPNTTMGFMAAGGFSLGVIIISLIGGLLGFLLTMRKNILQCDYCGAVVAAG